MYSYRKPQPEPVQAELIVIQYPGIVKNLDRALETLGGLSRISQVWCILRKGFIQGQLNWVFRYRAKTLLFSDQFPVSRGIVIWCLLQNHFSGHALELRHTPENPYTSASVSEKKVDATVSFTLWWLLVVFETIDILFWNYIYSTIWAGCLGDFWHTSSSDGNSA